MNTTQAEAVAQTMQEITQAAMTLIENSRPASRTSKQALVRKLDIINLAEALGKLGAIIAPPKSAEPQNGSTP